MFHERVRYGPTLLNIKQTGGASREPNMGPEGVSRWVRLKKSVF